MDQIVLLSVSAIRKSPSNPRKHIRPGYISELAASVKDKGVIEPILVRPVPNPNGTTHELVFGECRWRASIEAQKDTIPAMVRELDDKQVLEIQVVENDMREDVHPVEQSAAYCRLIDEHGYSAEEIATKTGRSVIYVRQRLALAGLCDVARAALEEEKITVSVALMVARFPAEQQRVAIKTLVNDRQGEDVYERGIATVRQARTLLQHEVAQDLSKAPFGLDDTTFQAVGACTKCPKRTRTQVELFDLGKGDLCTDPSCYKQKVDVHWSRLKASGKRVLTPKESAKVFDRWGGDRPSYSSAYVAASDRVYENGFRSKSTTYGAQLQDKSKLVLARAPSGTIVELVPRKEVKSLQASSPAPKQGPSKHELEADLRRREARLIGEKLAQKFAAVKVASSMIDALCAATQMGLATQGAYKFDDIAKRRGIERQKLVNQKFDWGLLAEMAHGCLDSRFEPGKTMAAELCKAAGVDAPALKREAKKAQEKAQAERKARVAAKAKKAKAKTKPAAPKSKRKDAAARTQQPSAKAGKKR